jgi:hypothetical protein
MTLMRECSNCGCPEERLFRDSYTGVELCIPCLAEVINKINLSPGTEGDNLKQLLDDEGDTYVENDNDDVHVDVLKAVRSSPYNDPNR